MADHFTFFRMKALPGKRQAVVDQFAKWEREHKGAAKGFLRSIVVASNEDPDEIMAGVRFDSTEGGGPGVVQRDAGAGGDGLAAGQVVAEERLLFRLSDEALKLRAQRGV